MPPFHAFTLTAPGLLRAIVTEARISFAFDPVHPPNPTPPLHSFQAVWDTGATGSVISQRVVDVCRLKPVGMSQVSTAAGIYLCEVYIINIFLPNQVGFPNVTVTKANIKTTDVLIGMDLINKGDFALTHQHGNTVFSFRYPSLITVDFQKR
jgi:predicted aspartyl protease